MLIFLTIHDAFYILWDRVRENKSPRKLSKLTVGENKSAQEFSDFAQPSCAKISTWENLYEYGMYSKVEL